MNELHDSGQLVVLGAAIAHGAGGEQHQRRAQAFATAVDDVLRHLSDQDHIGMKSQADDRIHGMHVGGDRRK